MRKTLLILTILFCINQTSSANHITGGTIFYTLISQSGNNYTYSITLKLYRDALSTGAPLDGIAPIAIFDRVTGAMIQNHSITMSFQENLILGSPDQCIVNPPVVSYEVGYYTFTTTLPGTPNGYVIAYQRCCRIAGISNLLSSSSVGATYTAEIPGTNPLAGAPANSSANFVGPDTVIVCQQSTFSYSFAAMDGDGDSLAYYFCDAFFGAGQGNPAPNPPGPPPYGSVPYSFPFSGGSPLGGGVTLNGNTGLMSGIAPDAGIYVVTVCVGEYRNGVLIATQRKDLQIKVGDCNIAAANLAPQIVNCESFTNTFSNGGDQSLIHSYYWHFGDDPVNHPGDTSNLQTPTYTFSDTGTFVVTLITNRGEPCSDTGTTIIRIYPGFFAGFEVPTAGVCINHPVTFIDTTTSVYGVVNSWNWNFGDPAVISDTSRVQNPSYTYSVPGVYNVQLIVTCSKGCIDTVSNPITIYDKPPLTVMPKDTLICIPDGVQLTAVGNGVMTWTPNIAINNTNIPNPTVNPTTTTWYYVHLNDNGCLNDDSVRVRVVDHVTLNVKNDTTGCLGDAYQLWAQTDGLQFTWTPDVTLDNPQSLTPIATVNTTTNYQIVARIGSCQATENIVITVVPYPSANAGNDTSICFNSAAQLNASMVGQTFTWSPANSLNNPNILNPVATPASTTEYILSVFDDLGCPKPGKDTILVTVRPKVNAFAGRDTAVVVGQPLHLQATGGVSYLWSPPFALNNINIADPVAIYDGTVDTVRYRVFVSDEIGCLDSAFVNVAVFKTDPQIFVPTAFSPNGDGLNDVFRPIGVGIKRIEYFRVFNRWGQMVFSTVINNQGWDGKISGTAQSTNTFVWIVKGIDYLDRPFFKKGTVTLIR